LIILVKCATLVQLLRYGVNQKERHYGDSNRKLASKEIIAKRQHLTQLRLERMFSFKIVPSKLIEMAFLAV
jgi:hypothetical protein